jgi:hypothetical protein
MNKFPNFPLYTSIKYNKNSNNDLSNVQKDEIVTYIKNCNIEQHEIIFALIRAYYIDNNKNPVEDLLYNAKLLKGGIKYDIDQIPSGLQHLLYSFISIPKT